MRAETPGVKTAAPPRRWGQPLIVAAVLTTLTVMIFGQVLVAGPHVVLSMLRGDLATEFWPAWQFGFGQLTHGHLALWNPYIYGGAPFLGNFQSALLYPPNWLFMVLPEHRAVNVGIALHVLILGLCMYAWARLRGLSLPAGLLAAVMAMLGSAFFLHITPGHFPHVCTMAWAPLVMAAIDGCFDRRGLAWPLAGALALALMIFAGFPQNTLFTGVAAGIYAIGRLAGRARQRASERAGAPAVGRELGRIAALLAVLVVAGSALGAVQLLTGLDASRDSIRGAGLSFGRAGSFSFPPENLLTLVAPGFFSGPDYPEYWGRWHCWEATLFVSIAGLLLAGLGAVRGRVLARWSILATLAITLVLAMGMYTPLFGLLYAHVGIVRQIRGMDKFAFQASLMLSVLAGSGLDYLLASRRPPWAFCAIAATAAVALIAGALWINHAAMQGPAGPWHRLVAGMDRGLKGELRPVLVYPHAYEDPLRMLLWARNSRNSLFVGAGVFGLCALLLALVRRWRAAPYALALLAAVELLVFAFHALPTFDPVHTRTAMEVTQLQAGDSRVLNLYNANEGMQSGLYDVWGRGPDVRRRWAEYIYFAQEEPMELVCQYCAFRHWDRWRMLLPTRLTYPLLPGSGGQPVMAHLSGALERLTLVKRWRVLTDRDQVLSAMLDEAFDPRQVVILEHSPELVRARPQATLAASVPAASMPVGAPAAALVGSVRCTQRDTGFSVIEADLSSPAVLLITDAYDRSWRATALPGSAQAQYRLMPGDWAFQAVPLVAGHHRLRIEYRPAAYEVGKWISLTALAGYLGTWLWLWRARKNTRPRDTE